MEALKHESIARRAIWLAITQLEKVRDTIRPGHCIRPPNSGSRGWDRDTRSHVTTSVPLCRCAPCYTAEPPDTYHGLHEVPRCRDSP